MTVLTRPVELPREALVHVWQLENLGGVHPVLGESELYVPATLGAEFTRRCMRALADLGLATAGETLTREFRVTLRVLASPARELYAWSSHTDPSQNCRLAAAAAGGRAVAMQVRGEAVVLAAIDESQLVETFIAELPEFPPASIRPLHLTRSAYDQRDDNHDMFAATQSPAKQLEKLMQAPRAAVHKVYAAGTSGSEHVRSKPFSVIDIENQGRVLTFTDARGDIHCLPGTPGHLTQTFHATWQSM